MQGILGNVINPLRGIVFLPPSFQPVMACRKSHSPECPSRSPLCNLPPTAASQSLYIHKEAKYIEFFFFQSAPSLVSSHSLIDFTLSLSFSLAIDPFFLAFLFSKTVMYRIDKVIRNVMLIIPTPSWCSITDMSKLISFHRLGVSVVYSLCMCLCLVNTFCLLVS